ncbi:PAS-domain containing protein [Phaeobacter marinintestinus]|uniref:PAS-domain containing protein n=1 Tax=Falsiphaeobacter marinintestinus TaxID=1492905 RepID=UPI001FE9E736|nr:PAS-domain containing protein [Phaeobacter marinintestinus]
MADSDNGAAIMEFLSLSDLAILAVICIGSSVAAVLWLSPRRPPAPQIRASALTSDMVFLFDGVDLIDATTAGHRMLESGKDPADWTTLRRKLMQNFPGFPADPDDIRIKGRILIPAIDTKLAKDAICEWIDGIARVELRKNRAETDTAFSPELEILRVAMDSAPYPVWRADAQGNVHWCNAAYAALASRIHGKGSDTTTSLFKLTQDAQDKGLKRRVSIPDPTCDKKLWYDVTVVEQPEGFLCYAVDINAVVDAEIAQRNFVQTLAKTFAQLSIGLAIFDRNRQLALFNPALIDLTSLPADFLSARPNLLTFFDRLRDRSMMPEPKNYRSWRDRMTGLVEAAAVGNYQETWTLPSGSVYSVSGRPHPDGAVAFLFEDITAEITLTRRFRSELELGQSVMDTLDDAIVVFSPDGALAFSNEAYNQMWEVDPDRSFAQVTVVDATRSWQDRCIATPLWGEIRDFVDSRENRAGWWAEAHRRTGDMLVCTIHPIPSGATMVSFRRQRDTPSKGPPGQKTLAGDV